MVIYVYKIHIHTKFDFVFNKKKIFNFYSLADPTLNYFWPANLESSCEKTHLPN